MIVLLAAGCAAPAPAPVEDRSQGRPATPSTPARGGVHVVGRGDTLYSIAFRYGLDWRDLAHWNGVSAPFTIYPGQSLRLDGSGRPAEQPRVAAADPAPRETSPVPSSTPTVPDSRPEPEPGPERGPEAEPEPEPSREPDPPRADPEPPPAAVASAPGRPAADAPERSVAGVQWRWPTEGRLSRRFDPANDRKGIEIGGREGQSVAAAADGQVVYSGTGLLGYGELIIIKHSNSLLSAYGHNRQRLVNEGDQVRGGQQIAELGRNERNEELLHFEIRRNGEPADPLGFLPPR